MSVLGRGRSWPRVGLWSLAVLGAVAAAFAAVAVPAAWCARKFENDRCFLKPYRAPFDVESLFSYRIQYVCNSDEPNDVVFVGSSHCFNDIRVAQFEHRTGLRAYNLGLYAGAGFSSYNLVTKRYLEHHPAPKILVFCAAPFDVGPPRVYKGMRESERYSGQITERFLWCYGDEFSFPRPAHANPLKFFIREGMRMAVGWMHGGQDYYFRQRELVYGAKSYYELQKELSQRRGTLTFFESYQLPEMARRTPDAELMLPAEGGTKEDPFPISRAALEGMRELARLAAEHGILLMIRLAPVLQGDSVEHFHRLRAWCDLVESEFPQVVCDRPEVLLYKPDCFADWVYHCNLRGAERFTDLLAARVVDLLDSKSDARQQSATSSNQGTDVPLRSSVATDLHPRGIVRPDDLQAVGP